MAEEYQVFSGGDPMGQGKGRASRRRTLPHLRRARRVAWLGLVLLILNALSPTLADALSDAPRSSTGLSAARTSLDDLLNGRLVICTPTGLRVITLDADGHAVTDASDKAYNGICPFCPPLSSAASGALPVLATLLILPAEPPPAPPVSAETDWLCPAQESCRVRAPRGPPSVV